jgi:hypothetical protein
VGLSHDKPSISEIFEIDSFAEQEEDGHARLRKKPEPD